MKNPSASLESLQSEWKELYQNLLPTAARSHDPAQSKWPVSLDHCFARIILDHAVGINAPWPSKIKSPAYKNMSTEQLEASIILGRKILSGKADLVDLDNRSLQLRGKRQKGGDGGVMVAAKRTRDVDEVIEIADKETPARKKRGKPVEPEKAPLQETASRASPSTSPEKGHGQVERSRYFTTTDRPRTTKMNRENEDLTPYLKKIALSHKTPFQKRVLSLLCQIPRGRYTTYAAISRHLSSCPRAVGSAIRNNPFAPQVPCHRVLASGGGIGGFHGSWGRNGKAGLNDDEKRKMLRDEGVRFDGGGKVVGGVWEGFK